MPSQDRLKVAVMSFAHVHSLSYVDLLLGYDDIDIRASDPGPHPISELRGHALADQLGVAYEDSFEELLAWGPDAVVITAENANHRALVEAAAAAGADILCEKPIANTIEDACAMKSAAKSAGVALMIALPVRFATAFNELKIAYSDGKLGELVSIHGNNNSKLPQERAWFTNPELSGGGALVDHIVHIADLIEDLTHANPVSVTAITNRILHGDRAHTETGGLVTITYDTGLIAAIDCSWSQPDTAPTWGGLVLTAAGTAGSVTIDFFGSRLQGIDSATGLPIEIPCGPNFDDIMLRSFLDGVRAGTTPEPGPDVAIKSLQIVLAAQQSAATGTTVTIAPAG